MVLLGLGIIFASLTYIAFSHPPATWQRWLRLLWPGAGNDGRQLREQRTTSRQLTLPAQKKKKLLTPIREETEPGSASKGYFEVADEDDSEEEDDTPKGSPRLDASPTPTVQIAVPQFSFESGEKKDKVEVLEPPTISPVPIKKSSPSPSPTISSMPPPRSTQPLRPPATSLMPPPSVHPSSLRPLPKLSPSGGSLAPPPSAASTLRLPPNRLPQPTTSNTGASTSTLPPSQRPSRKVILPPGHSPLDWAALTSNPPNTTFLRGSDIPPGLIRVTPSTLKLRNGRKGRDAWGVYQGKVYNLTPYMNFHPGGVGELMRGAGKPDTAERLFNEIHPWVSWEAMLGECLIGILVGEGEKEEKGELETLD